jgi:enoyl-[acyl-carrier protein] reductase I
MPLDVVKLGVLEAVFAGIEQAWGKLDILLHSIAFAPKADLQGGLLDCSADGLCQGNGRILPLLHPHGKTRCPADDGGRMYVGDELLRGTEGRSQLQCHGTGQGGPGGVLPLPGLRTWAAEDPHARNFSRTSEDPRSFRVKDFDLLLNEAGTRAPVGEPIDIMDVGFACAYLATPYARRITGETVYVDGGVNIMA